MSMTEKIGMKLGRAYVRFMSRLRGERLSPKGEMLAEYCNDILRGSERRIDCYEKVIESTMELNDVGREEACRILGVVLGAMR